MKCFLTIYSLILGVLAQTEKAHGQVYRDRNSQQMLYYQGRQQINYMQWRLWQQQQRQIARRPCGTTVPYSSGLLDTALYRRITQRTQADLANYKPKIDPAIRSVIKRLNRDADEVYRKWKLKYP